MVEDILEFCITCIGFLILFLVLAEYAPVILCLLLIIGFCYLLEELADWWDKRHTKSVEHSQPTPSPPELKLIYKPKPKQNLNPYSLEELQNHLDAYRQKAINSGNRDKWKYGRDYERYIGYLWEKDGWKVIYNGAVEGNFDGGIDLICYKDNDCCLIQCKRWKNNVGAEYIERFNKVVERFTEHHFNYNEVIGVFYTTSNYTDDAREVGWEYDIDCRTERFGSIREYPPVKCLVRNDEKVYYLPFDKEFDKISVKNGCDYKFTVADAEKAGYHYHLNHDVLLKVVKSVPRSQNRTSVIQPAPLPETIIIIPPALPLKIKNHNEWLYWKDDKNYPVGYHHADYFEFVDLKSCKIHSYIEGCFIFSAKYIRVNQFLADWFYEGKRFFKYGLGLPQVYQNNEWKIIPIYRECQIGEGYLSYIEKQKMYAYTMFKIVYHELFGKEYQDSCKYGWHYDKGYPEYC